LGEAAFLAISGVTLIACSRLLPAQGGRELLAIATIETFPLAMFILGIGLLIVPFIWLMSNSKAKSYR
jgi:hypothetical protein